MQKNPERSGRRPMPGDVSRAQPGVGNAHYHDSALVHQSTRDVRSDIRAGRRDAGPRSTKLKAVARIPPEYDIKCQRGVRLTTAGRPTYTEPQQEKLRQIHARLIEARRELDALIGDAYLRPRANIVPVHFLDLASATEKLRWAEKEWRELERELGEREGSEDVVVDHPQDELGREALVEAVHAEGSRR